MTILNRCRKGHLIGFVAIPSLTALLLLAIILYAGNPQWNRWIYIFQAYVLQRNSTYQPLDGSCYMPPPSNFTGTWRMWYRDGAPLSREGYRNGLLHGPCQWWNPNGLIAAIGFYQNGLQDGKQIGWNFDGNLIAIETFRQGKPHGESMLFDKGTLTEFTSYRDGKLYGWSFEGIPEGTPPELQIDSIRYHQNNKAIYTSDLDDLLPEAYLKAREALEANSRK